ncbi:unnamed protein product [Vitrella brassicaformis CCMP3155]|uniref:Uncharacterized protein n=1 Tax=Vitrella brassicaformis (strain CCMP3155) TaxID=1169540 RepID=A0A0G4FXU4_VITBC|nr:unnamed protein product [Vitrella brassicaformis CCMP3155]|eukprot:CEM20243.1 unnamed protein product [Vitrella brassicaformis CCMP3155]
MLVGWTCHAAASLCGDVAGGRDASTSLALIRRRSRARGAFIRSPRAAEVSHSFVRRGRRHLRARRHTAHQVVVDSLSPTDEQPSRLRATDTDSVDVPLKPLSPSPTQQTFRAVPPKEQTGRRERPTQTPDSDAPTDPPAPPQPSAAAGQVPLHLLPSVEATEPGRPLERRTSSNFTGDDPWVRNPMNAVPPPLAALQMEYERLLRSQWNDSMAVVSQAGNVTDVPEMPMASWSALQQMPFPFVPVVMSPLGPVPLFLPPLPSLPPPTPLAMPPPLTPFAPPVPGRQASPFQTANGTSIAQLGEASRTSNVIDGRAMAEQVRNEVREEISWLLSKPRVGDGRSDEENEVRRAFVRPPSLAVILVGERWDSETYVRMKKKAADEVGIECEVQQLPASINQFQLIERITRLNRNATVDGIIVQLPLPAHIDSRLALSAIDYAKDVDGLHPNNVGNLALRNFGGSPSIMSPDSCLFKPCTPLGCVELLKRSYVPIEGAKVVVLGRSSHVGLPAALLLAQENATVTMLHSKTLPGDIRAAVQLADIIVAAMGRPRFITADMVKPGAVVLDVGINSVPDASKRRGYRLVGDVDFETVRQVAGLITPVPGGVGPMTVAMLMRNTLDSSKRRQLMSMREGRAGMRGARESMSSRMQRDALTAAAASAITALLTAFVESGLDFSALKLFL